MQRRCVRVFNAGMMSAASLHLQRMPHSVSLISGVSSSFHPRGIAPLEVRDSDAVIEELAEHYVNMDLHTMSKLHTLAVKAMVGPHAQVEDLLLQGMGGGPEGGGATVAAAPAAAATAAPTDAEAAPASKKAAQEKHTFNVTLAKYPAANKIKLIKELRAICGLSIADAKAAIESCPGVIAKQLPKADAEKLESVLKTLGAEVVLA